jgi:serine-type D-Ala-D-Ala carboxypeptidase/endopeptidase (penicillin-binding protein 4)
MKYGSIIGILVITAMMPGCSSTRGNKITHSAIGNHHLAKQIESIIKDTDPDVNVGIKISSLHDGKVIFEKNSSRHFVPGSTVKLITLAAALHYLGPYFRFETTISTDKPIDAHGAVENLYIQGSGDPSLMDTDLIALVDELKQMGIKHVNGNIYIDDQIFDDVLWGKGAMWDDRNRGFSAPTAGLNLNYNRLLIKTLPSQVGQPAYTIKKPAASFVDVVGQTVTKTSGAGKQVSISVERNKKRESNWPNDPMDGLHLGDKVFITGHTSLNIGPHYSSLAINDPGIFTGIFIKDQLDRSGIKVKGKVSRLGKPANAVRLAIHESRSLAEALIDFTKISNNLGNDVLLKTIAANNGTKPATFTAGLKLVNNFLKSEVGLDPSSLITADGAGLSRYNLVTPDQMVKLLTYAGNHFHLAPEFISSLPIGGEDGLLRSRLTDDVIRKNVRAKTGSFTGVSCLAGYLTGMDGNRYAFAIMVNGFIGPTSKYARMQDQILSSMITDDQTELAKVK